MPLEFFRIPEHVRISIVQKLDAKDFVSFHESSRGSFNTARMVKTRFTIKVSSIHANEADCKYVTVCSGKQHRVATAAVVRQPIRIVASSIYLDKINESTVKWVVKFLLLTRSTALYIYIDSFMSCSPQEFNNLLYAAKIKDVHSFDPVKTDFLRVPGMKKVLQLYMAESDLNDEAFLSLKVRDMVILDTNITCSAINLALKEWLRNERPIKRIKIITSHKFDKDVVLKRITYTKVDPWWNPLDGLYHIQKSKRNKISVIVDRCGHLEIRKIDQNYTREYKNCTLSI